MVVKSDTNWMVGPLLIQFNDALLYTTSVQSGQYKLNNMLSLAGMKVGAVCVVS